MLLLLGKLGRVLVKLALGRVKLELLLLPGRKLRVGRGMRRLRLWLGRGLGWVRREAPRGLGRLVLGLVMLVVLGRVKLVGLGRVKLPLGLGRRGVRRGRGQRPRQGLWGLGFDRRRFGWRFGRL